MKPRRFVAAKRRKMLRHEVVLKRGDTGLKQSLCIIVRLMSATSPNFAPLILRLPANAPLFEARF
ncbi:hypothetical protein UB31_37140 [Bradyrhizobium sp. LTSP849]|nr:hypothetical protein UB31_37140 [Bradyrhizobium sp. LTSP849]